MVGNIIGVILVILVVVAFWRAGVKKRREEARKAFNEFMIEAGTKRAQFVEVADGMSEEDITARFKPAMDIFVVACALILDRNKAAQDKVAEFHATADRIIQEFVAESQATMH